MGFTSKGLNICRGCHSKRPRSAGDDILSVGAVKSPWRNGMDRTRAGTNFTTLDIDDIPLPRQEMTDSDARESADVEVNRRYAGIGYGVSAMAVLVRFARDDFSRANSAYRWLRMRNFDIMDYVQKAST